MKKNQSGILGALLVIIVVISIFFVGYRSVAITSTPVIEIEHDRTWVGTRQVTLFVAPPPGAHSMIVSNDPDFDGAVWGPIERQKSWALDYGNGQKYVYIQFRNVSGTILASTSDSIVLSVPYGMDVDFQINGGDTQTDTRNVMLTVSSSLGVEDMTIHNTTESFNNVQPIPVQTSLPWVLTQGSGRKVVHIRFRNSNGQSTVVTKKITYTQPTNYIGEGSLIQSADSPVYYVGFDGKIHPFLHPAVYFSWYKKTSTVRYVSPLQLHEYYVGQPVCIKPGTWLVQFDSAPPIYAVETGCGLRELRSVPEATLLYGKNWKDRVISLPRIHEGSYRFTRTSAEDLVNELYDRDHDQVNHKTEIARKTSDAKSDTDGDGLSDYEEIFYWFSDPTSTDTDSDGFLDGDEVIMGFSPVGTGKFSIIPNGTYPYPAGSVVFDAQDGYSYWIRSNNLVYKVQKGLSGVFASNRIDSSFLIYPLVNMRVWSKSVGKVESVESELVEPTVFVSGRIISL